MPNVRGLLRLVGLGADPAGTPADGSRYFHTGRGVDRVYTTADGWQDQAAGRLIGSSPNGTRYELRFTDDGGVYTVDAALIVFDSFDRANQQPLGVATSGQTWEIVEGSGIEIMDNQAGCAATLAARLDVIDAGVTDCEVSGTFAVKGGVSPAMFALALRVTDASNYLRLNSSGQLVEVVAGVATTLGTLSGGVVVGGDTVKVVADGALATVSRNGVEELEVAVSIVTGEKHGLYMRATGHRFDDFRVRAL